MASIYLNRKDGKIVSFKFKAFLGRDENGRQIVKCTTWTADCSLSEKRLLQLAKKESTIISILIEECECGSASTKGYVAYFVVQECPKILKENLEKKINGGISQAD